MNGADGIIVKAIDGFYYVLSGGKIYSCKSRKKFRFNDIEPKVGDNVMIGIIDENKKEGVLEKIYERSSDFIRPQIANVTQVFIVLSYLEPKINFEMLNKLLINFEASNVVSKILINKSDLHTNDDNFGLEKTFRNFPYEIVYLSVKNNYNIELVKGYLKNNITCFCGPSGVGKSSLLNKIVDDNVMEISDLSAKIKRGRHTTRFSQLIYLKDIDGYIIDTPGFTSIEISKQINQNNLKDYFVDFYEYSDCKFRECRHINEVECGVKEALKNGNINNFRYDMYVKLYNKFKEKSK